ncbi:MAG: hypothetical protein A2096_13305 [Spirochaetes bacterium GWF1_41_5]|nr:MAG: hypothetical protein A2096_13305 [Spirochaetes bacterium GWF1_41_5]
MKIQIYFQMLFLVFISSTLTAENESGLVLYASFDKKIDADFAHSDKKAEFNNIIQVKEGKINSGIKITSNSWFAFNAAENFGNRGGTIMFWLKPEWNTASELGHTIFSAGLDYEKPAYFALSDKWWEHTEIGRQHVYFFRNNQEGNNIVVKHDFSINQWCHIACVWKNGNEGFKELYINGKLKKSEKNKTGIPEENNFKNKIFFGADLGAEVKHGDRWGVGIYDEIKVYDKPLAKDEITAEFGKVDDTREVLRNEKPWLTAVLARDYKPRRNAAGTILENRMIFLQNSDNDDFWLIDESADKSLTRIKAAGFNIVLLNIYHFFGAFYPTETAPRHMYYMKNHKDLMDKAFQNNRDPLKEFIKKAHAQGIQVCPSISVVSGFRPSYPPGVPEFFSDVKQKAWGMEGEVVDVHKEAYRKYILNVMEDIVRRYDIDAVILDYIRTKVFCTCTFCQAEYKKESGRDLITDKNSYTDLPQEEKEKSAIYKWQCEPVDDILIRFNKAVRVLKPDLPIGVFSHLYIIENKDLQGRRPLAWVKNKYIDFAISMCYESGINHEEIDLIKKITSRPDALSLIFGNFKDEMREESVNLLAFHQKKWTGASLALYEYRFMDDKQIAVLNSGIFKEKAQPSWDNILNR